MVITDSKALSFDIKTSNASLVLRLIRENAPLSRADLSRITGLTRSTVSALIGPLIELDILQEIGFNNPGGVGKRATMLDIRTDKLFALAVKFSHNRIHMAKVDMRGELHNQIKQPLVGGAKSKEQALEILYKMAHTYLDRVQENGESCIGIGISVPSPLKDGVMAYAASFHCLEGVDLKAALQGQFDMPVHVNNDADAAAMAEVWFGGYPPGTNIAFVLLHHGIGCGFMRDKELYIRGLQTSNELGHIRIESGGPVCYCGKSGCLSAFASEWAIYQRLPADIRAQIDREVQNSGDMNNLEKMMVHMRGNPKIYAKYIAYAAKYLGIGIANLVEMFTPDVIVTDGEPVDIPGFMDMVERSCEKNTHPLFVNTYRICRSRLKKDAALTGAGTFLIRDIYVDPFRNMAAVKA